MSKTKDVHYFTFGTNFERKFVQDTVKHPDVTLIELVSNSWDAGATKVEINWPEVDLINGEIFTIKDNGFGMTKKEFLKYWGELGGDKRDNIGSEITLKDGTTRKILGRNGKGRLGLFGFSDSYKVITCKENEKSIFEVEKIEKSGQYAKIIDEHVESYDGDFSGTYIECPLHHDYLNKDKIEIALSTRFGADPHFKVYLNDKEIKLLDLEKYEKKKLEFKGFKVEIAQIPRDVYNKKLSQYQIVWWVNQKCAEFSTWKELDIPLDGKNKIENKFAFCIIVDFMEEHVKPEGFGFEDNDMVKELKKFVKEEIIKLAEDYIKESHRVKKIKVVRTSEEHIKNLNPVSQEEVGRFIDEVINQCSIKPEDLSKIVSILVTMEESNRKHELLDKLVELDYKDMDKLVEILDKWSVEDAYTVLGELYWRLEIISKLEMLVDDIETLELPQLQPLFETGLWMFGPEYEGTTNFTSNKSLKKALREVLGVDIKKFDGSNKRPDLVATPEGDIWNIYGSNKLKDSQVVGYRKVLVIELKKGNSTISYEEMNQARFYVKKLKKHGKLQKDTKIVCYVLGSKVDEDNKDEEIIGNMIKVYPSTYDTIIRNAKLRTLDLMDKIKDVKGITDIGDPEINEVMKEDFPEKTFAP
ncbi:MAG: ATP-binding protein [Methanobacterium sp.]|uniref:ATP-binding protein n=1 Tax=Methanobacterium sp. TaxID=2164 RepID=UPI003D648E82|nr:ATP-binding protein [Methanobacterium sp.]